MVLSGAYIWNGVTVDDNCEVQRALLDDNVHLYRNTKIQQGCVLAAGVSLSVCPSVRPPARLSICSSADTLVGALSLHLGAANV